MLPRQDMDGNLVLAHQLIRESDVVEVVYFDHQMIDAALGSGDAERERMLPLIAMHEDRSDYTFAHADFILNPTAHTQKVIEPIGSLDIFLANNTVAQSTCSSLETPMHSPSRTER